MCGITGFVDFTGNSHESYILDMVNSLKHRGPDDSGHQFYTDNQINIAFGNARLAVIDTSPSGHQPMKYLNFSTVYNGEIYNFKELKSELVGLGHKFVTNSDTEVLLHSYSEWGKNAVKKFIGEFAFAIIDKTNNKIEIYRDRPGLKPLYYYWNNDLFMFASELKSFHLHPNFDKEINPDSLGMFFKYGHIPFPYSIYSKVKKLPPGCRLSLKLNSQSLNLEQYWNVADYYLKEKLDIDYPEAIIQTEKLLKSACEYRMISDVPVGIFLSRGYDSTAITALLQSNFQNKLRTFSIGFENKNYNEAHISKKIAAYLCTDHSEYYCSVKDAEEIIPYLANYYDEPFADSSAIPTILVSKFARKDVTVALTGDAGDELFAGYKKDIRTVTTHKILSKIPMSHRRKLFRLLSAMTSSVNNLHVNLARLSCMFEELQIESPELKSTLIKNFTYFTRPNVVKQLVPKLNLGIKTAFDSNFQMSIVDQMLTTNYLTCLTDDMLTKVDRATMSYSLEARAPFLDHRLLEFVAQLPSEYKISGTKTKIILKDIVKKYVPDDLLNHPKIGFRIPIFGWLRNELSYFIDEYCSPAKLKKLPYVDSIVTTKIIDNFKKGSTHHNNLIWQLIMYSQWHEKWAK